MRYRVIVDPGAARELRRLNRQPIHARLIAAIDALQDNPRPPGCKKLSVREEWRIRVGDYRIIYDIADTIRIVTITRVRKRGDVYED